MYLQRDGEGDGVVRAVQQPLPMPARDFLQPGPEVRHEGLALGEQALVPPTAHGQQRDEQVLPQGDTSRRGGGVAGEKEATALQDR